MKIVPLLHRVRTLNWIQALLLGTSLSFGLAQGQEVRIEAYGPAFTAPELAPKTQARIYAYRPQTAVNPAPVNLYLNGRYHASLLAGGYTEFCLSPGRVALQSTVNDASQLHMGKTQAGHPLEVIAGRVVYLRLTEGNVQNPTDSLALPEIGRTRRQIHTISRAPEVQTCSTDLAVPVKPVAKTAPKRDFTLAADALFEFGKAELKPEGVRALKALVLQVKQEYSQIDRIHVLGYTDAIGPALLNSKLSAARAHSVAQLLDQNDLHPHRGYTTEGRGSAELAKLGCQNKPTPKNKACHASNRRVVVSVTGARK